MQRSSADGRGESDTPGRARVEPQASVRSAELFGGRREVVILHGGEEYRLRITRAGKLILTK